MKMNRYGFLFALSGTLLLISGGLNGCENTERTDRGVKEIFARAPVTHAEAEEFLVFKAELKQAVEEAIDQRMKVEATKEEK